MEFKRILIAVDGSPPSNHAALRGIGLAKDSGATITFVTVIGEAAGTTLSKWQKRDQPNQTESVAHLTESNANQILAAVADLAQRAGVNYSSEKLVSASPSKGILLAAMQASCDLIVIGTHGYTGLSKLLLGSNAAAVLADSSVPLLICK
jgi:nucleotide-binding universal stress UspA family protein